MGLWDADDWDAEYEYSTMRILLKEAGECTRYYIKCHPPSTPAFLAYYDRRCGDLVQEDMRSCGCDYRMVNECISYGLHRHWYFDESAREWMALFRLKRWYKKQTSARQTKRVTC